eukprot:scaffold457918_cov17-Prasinocladus_malaysianus.AAC.1
MRSAWNLGSNVESQFTAGRFRENKLVRVPSTRLYASDVSSHFLAVHNSHRLIIAFMALEDAN